MSTFLKNFMEQDDRYIMLTTQRHQDDAEKIIFSIWQDGVNVMLVFDNDQAQQIIDALQKEVSNNG